MKPEELQLDTPQDEVDLSTDDLAAAMGFMTTIGEQGMMAQQAEQEALQAPQMAEMPQGEEMMPEAEETPEVDTEGLKNEIMKEVKSAIKEEIGGLKEMLKEALNEDDDDKEE